MFAFTAAPDAKHGAVDVEREGGDRLGGMVPTLQRERGAVVWRYQRGTVRRHELNCVAQRNRRTPVWAYWAVGVTAPTEGAVDWVEAWEVD